jgi:hypothetical protein
MCFTELPTRNSLLRYQNFTIFIVYLKTRFFTQNYSEEWNKLIVFFESYKVPEWYINSEFIPNQDRLKGLSYIWSRIELFITFTFSMPTFLFSLDLVSFWWRLLGWNTLVLFEEAFYALVTHFNGIGYIIYILGAPNRIIQAGECRGCFKGRCIVFILCSVSFIACVLCFVWVWCVILCDVCYLCVVSYCSITATG